MSTNLDREYHPIVGLIVRFIFGALVGGLIWLGSFRYFRWYSNWSTLASWPTLVVFMAGFGLTSARYGNDFWERFADAASWWRWR